MGREVRFFPSQVGEGAPFPRAKGSPPVVIPDSPLHLQEGELAFCYWLRRSLSTFIPCPVAREEKRRVRGQDSAEAQPAVDCPRPAR